MPPNKWEQTKTYSKKGFDAAWSAFDKLGRPVNKLSNKIGSESFWPTTLDKESDKAARILRSFCKDGFYEQVDAEAERHGKLDTDVPAGKQRVLKTIPPQVIRQAKGLAIFTTMRTGLWISGAGGSGVLVARVPETGEWSPPSGIMLHTAGLGFLIGVDIYDCVIVINDYKALEAFKKVRCTLGGEVSAVAGPVGVGGIVETEVHKRQAPLFTYLKSRGFYAGVQVDGTIVIERTDENERFYGERLGVEDILAGKVRHPPYEIETLMNTIKAAQGDINYDEKLLPPPGAPGDLELEVSHFAIPDPDDPDPYGVKALTQEGVLIREAGSGTTPSLEAFEFRPSEKSPIYKRWSGMDSRRGSWRNSISSVNSIDRGTQTDDLPPYPGSATASLRHRSQSSSHQLVLSPIPVDEAEEEAGAPPQSSTSEAIGVRTPPRETSPVGTPFSRARLVTISKRAPPPLPPRNPERPPNSASSDEEAASAQPSRANEQEVTKELPPLPPSEKPEPPALPERKRSDSDELVATSTTDVPVLSTPPPLPKRDTLPEPLAALVTKELKQEDVAAPGTPAAPPALPPREPTQSKSAEEASITTATTTTATMSSPRSDQSSGIVPFPALEIEKEYDDDFHSIASVETASREPAETKPDDTLTHGKEKDGDDTAETTTAAKNEVATTTAVATTEHHAEDLTPTASRPSTSSFEHVDAIGEQLNKVDLKTDDAEVTKNGHSDEDHGVETIDSPSVSSPLAAAATETTSEAETEDKKQDSAHPSKPAAVADDTDFKSIPL
ncbi:hypothetical protein KEM52_002836 [Ascosphaera acerosa]|nr:hypothetical protein KEM52_002836 [Ascosphaera acerosa]